MENTIKEFMEDTELQSLINEEVQDATYAVWAIGYDADNKVTDAEVLLGEFQSPDQAIMKATAVTLADVVHQAAEDWDGSESADVAYISVEVETVVDDGEDGTMNVGTIFKKTISLIEDEPAEDEYSGVIPVTEKDYKLLEDGSIEIDCEILKNFNKNDQVQIWFTDEDNVPILTYKIISKTTAGKYICEFVY